MTLQSGLLILMIIYVSFGGMIATTWVQIIKAFLLIFGATVLSFLVLKEFSFSLTNLLDVRCSSS